MNKKKDEETREEQFERLWEEMMPPDEAVEAYPDECANCGAGADPFWIPDDYHERDSPNPGVCTECGHHFGSGKLR